MRYLEELVLLYPEKGKSASIQKFILGELLDLEPDETSEWVVDLLRRESLSPSNRVRNQARAAAQIGAIAASTEIFGWMTRHPEHLVSQALSKPGHELQHRLSTAEPTAEQLEVAEAALAACLDLEDGES